MSGPTINIEHERRFDALNGLVMAQKKRHPRKDVSISGVEQGGTVEKLNPSQLRWAPPVHEATGGHGFSTVPPCDYLLSAVATSTAQATVQPTIGLLPMPRNPIISTCAGTDDEPANCASECIRTIVSVMYV